MSSSFPILFYHMLIITVISPFDWSSTQNSSDLNFFSLDSLFIGFSFLSCLYVISVIPPKLLGYINTTLLEWLTCGHYYTCLVPLALVYVLCDLPLVFRFLYSLADRMQFVNSTKSFLLSFDSVFLLPVLSLLLLIYFHNSKVPLLFKLPQCNPICWFNYYL